MFARVATANAEVLDCMLQTSAVLKRYKSFKKRGIIMTSRNLLMQLYTWTIY